MSLACARKRSRRVPPSSGVAIRDKGSDCSMVTDNKDKSSKLPELPETEVQNHQDDAALDGPFTPKQMRALKWLTGTMGVMIVICVILLGIGLSRQSAKLASDAPTPDIALPSEAKILGITADGHGSIWPA